MSEVFGDDRSAKAGAIARLRKAAAEIPTNPAARYEPFPLTEVQKAYWLGRSDYFELGNIGCHTYLEVAMPLVDPARVQEGWQQLIDRHDMLRAIVRDDGLQQVLADTPRYEMKHLSPKGMEPAAFEAEFEAMRQRMSHQVFAANQWPLFELRTSERGGQTLLHFSMDLLFVDLWSIQLLRDELLQVVYGRTHLAPLETRFRDYVLSIEQRRETPSYKRAEQYWLSRLDTLAPSPRLPLARSAASIQRPKFARREFVLRRELWEKLKARSAKDHITPPGILTAAFARVLGAWSQSPHFTINITLSDRTSLNPQLHRLVGDFTALMLLEVRDDDATPIDVLAKKIARQFRSDVRHREYGALQVLQELARRGDPDRPPIMPIVFTAAILENMPGRQSADSVTIDYGLSQTPQVYLDHQVYEHRGDLHLTWDAVDELFPPGLLDDMLGAYSAFLERLAQDEAAWLETSADLLPRAQLTRRAAINDTAAPVPERLLHAPFLDQVRRQPDATAIVGWDRRLSYADVYRLAGKLAVQLRERGAGPNRLVAIVMEKGWEQVVAAIGILEAGGAYLPIDPDLPQERIWLLLRRGEVDVVVTQPCHADRLKWPSDLQCVTVAWEDAGSESLQALPLEPPSRPDDLAYVIFTSGSTGEPKGVMVEHRSALNTVLDINDRFGVSADDRILALSSLSFDLSVYDVFGALAAGAAIVLPHPTSAREPGDWAHLVLNEKITIWNSVPALLDLLVDHVGGRQELLGRSLRLALLSGDWIALGLPDRARAILPGMQTVSLGGATEASIWSIFFPIAAVEPEWKSIPYGRPLLNQQMHVLDDAMKPCPVWVAGQIHIGGIGLARGYWRDEEKTGGKFVRHPRSGERLYRTGDMGRYLPDGNIEFLGREDDQVKVQGYRIELGEIEAALIRHPKVKAALVTAVGARGDAKHLAAYVVAEAEHDELIEYLKQTLPSYMVPLVWQRLDSLPLSANGKVNRKALPAPVSPAQAKAAAAEDHGDVLPRLITLISQVLGQTTLDPAQSLLTLGATSMDLVRIVGRLEKEFGFRPSFQQFYREPTTAALARLIQQRQGNSASPSTGNGAKAPRRTLEMIVDPAMREAFRRENHGIRTFPTNWGTLPLDRGLFSVDAEDRVRRRQATRRFLPEPVPQASFGAWLAELSRVTASGAVKYAYGSAGSCYSVQTYLHVKPDGITGCPAGTFYYHPVEHRLVPLTLGAELDPAIHEPFTNRPIFEQARFSLFLVSEPRAIEPMYGDLAGRFSLLEAGAMAHAIECSAWQFGLGVCPIGLLDFDAIRGLLHVDEGQELLHAHVGGLAESSADAADWEEGTV